MTLPTNPFHGYTLAQCLAFVAKRWGEEGLRQLLEGDPRRNQGYLTNREYLEDAVHELEALGLGKVAAIVSEYTAKCPSIYDQEIACPHMRKSHKKRMETDKAKYLWRSALIDSPPV
jgi:hypothetical protein